MALNYDRICKILIHVTMGVLRISDREDSDKHYVDESQLQAHGRMCLIYWCNLKYILL